MVRPPRQNALAGCRVHADDHQAARAKCGNPLRYVNPRIMEEGAGSIGGNWLTCKQKEPKKCSADQGLCKSAGTAKPRSEPAPFACKENAENEKPRILNRIGHRRVDMERQF